MSDDHSLFESDEEDNDFEDGLATPQELQQTLSKWTNYIHGWQDRWVVLKDGTLSYYKSKHDITAGCRGSMSLAKADIQAHEFDELRFDVTINDSVWYLRAGTADERHQWLEALEAHKAESGYGSESSLLRHGSMLSLTSGTSVASQSSFKKGRGLREKLAEMETFRDILCRQVDTLQSYFDSCAESVSLEDDPRAKWNNSDLLDEDGDDDIDDFLTPRVDNINVNQVNGHKEKGFSFPGSTMTSEMGVDFKGEAFTFKATTAGIIATLSHCIDLMRQREDQWQRRFEKEQERRKRAEESYRNAMAELKRKTNLGGPDYEEGPHSAINDEEFFDAVEAALDKRDKEEEVTEPAKPIHTPTPVAAKIEGSQHWLSEECNKKVDEAIKYVFEDLHGEQGTWQLVHEEGEMKVYRSEQEVDGIVVDPLKAIHKVQGITAHEMCHYFFDAGSRMEWNATLETADVIEVLSADTLVWHEVVKRVWPATQRDCVYCSHYRKVSMDEDKHSGTYLVCNFSVDHESRQVGNKCVRAKINIGMFCQTLVDPPEKDQDELTRDNVWCKITYTAHINPGGWAPASVLRAMYKREYPRFLRKFSSFVEKKVENTPIMW
ncbi:ceramide transfer protein-like [Ptychodera flava]|uniref:ceramide transfer protein-like n=1 Tax=Ptychodera flava TaxID=63121 RepID=UPI00396A4B51